MRVWGWNERHAFGRGTPNQVAKAHAAGGLGSLSFQNSNHFTICISPIPEVIRILLYVFSSLDLPVQLAALKLVLLTYVKVRRIQCIRSNMKKDQACRAVSEDTCFRNWYGGLYATEWRPCCASVALV